MLPFRTGNSQKKTSVLLLEEVLVDGLPPKAGDSARGELHFSKAGRQV